MDSRMIDVAIGLVLVFALSGLAVTTLHEIWSNLRKTRGRNLEVAIRSMLGDDKGEFAKAVLAHPLLASLTDTPMVGTGKPSYIGADALVTALISHLSKLYCAGVRPETPRAFVAALGQGRGKLAVTEPPPALLDSLGALLDGADADWTTYLRRVCAWYDAVGERSVGWFKRATQMRLFWLGLLLAAAVNINPFVIGPRLWNDEVLRKATVEAAQRASAAYAGAASAPDGELLRRVAAALPAPDNRLPAPATAVGANAPIHAEVDASLLALDQSLRTLLKAQNERGSIGLLTQLSAGLEQLTAIETFVKLRRSSALAGERQAVQDASASIDRRVEQFGLQPGDVPTDKTAFPALSGPLKKVLLAHQAELGRALLNEKRRLLPESPSKPGYLCPAGITPREQKLCEDLAGISKAIGKSGLPIGWTAANLPDCAEGPCVVKARQTQAADSTAASGKPGDDAWLTAQTCLKDLSCASVSLLGWLATALTAMLGAPFWFDLLAKLIKLRSAGAPAAGESTAKGASGGGSGDTAPAGLLAMPEPPAAPGGSQAPAPMRDVQTAAEASLAPERVRELQAGVLGRFGAKPSGFFDEDMRKAITAWQGSVQHSVTGELTQMEIELLLAPGLAQGPAPGLVPASGPTAADVDDGHVDGCDCAITSATPDESLPQAQGGVSTP